MAYLLLILTDQAISKIYHNYQTTNGIQWMLWFKNLMVICFQSQ